MRYLDKKFIIPIISVLLYILYVSYITIQSPLVAFTVKSDKGQWVVDEIFDNGWAHNQEIVPGDIILQINGQTPANNQQIMKYQVLRTAETLTFLDKSREEKHFTVTYTSSDIKQLISHLILPFAYMTLTIYVSFYIYRKQKDDPSALILIQFLLCIAIAYGSAGASSRGDVLARLANALTLAGCLILYIRFLHSFLKRLQITFIKQSNLRKLYYLLLVILVGNIISFIIPTFSSILTILELSIFSFLLLLILLLLLTRVAYYKEKTGIQAVKVLVFIFVLAVSPFTFLYVIPVILFQQYIINAEIAVAFLLLIPIGFIYLQLAEKLFDIDFIIGRFKYYTLLAFPFSFIVCGIISLSVKESLSTNRIGLIFIILFFSTVLFLYAKEWNDYKNRKYMFSSRGDLQTNLYMFFHKTKDENKVQVVIRRILKEMEDTLMVKEAIYLEMEQDNQLKDWSIHYKTSDIFIEPSVLEEIRWEHQAIGTIISLPRGFAIVIGSELHTKQIILCDDKQSHTSLNIEEKIWIEMMAYFSSVVVENMKLIEDLVEQVSKLQLQEKKEYPTWLSKLLFALSEKERANLSNDLHDSILQEQLQLLREIESVRKIAKDEEISGKLDEMKEQMLDNVHLIRETCMELRPPLLHEQGLLESLHQLIRKTKLRCNFLLRVSLDETIHVAKEQELIFYRIIQELLHNAMKHSNAKEVHLDFYSANQNIILFYKDDGVGADLNNDGYSFSSMGLVGMKERVRSMDGCMELKSFPGEGMQIRIKVGLERDFSD